MQCVSHILSMSKTNDSFLFQFEEIEDAFYAKVMLLANFWDLLTNISFYEVAIKYKSIQSQNAAFDKHVALLS